MAELKQIPDSSSGSQSNVYCTLNEDMRRIPSQTSQKGCMWYKRCWIPLMCGMLFVILLTTVTVSFKQQFSKLTEVENAVANLTASVVLLTSDQQDTSEILFLLDDRLMEMFGNLKADLESRITNLTRWKPVLSCKAGWQLYLSSCYLFSSTALDWQRSRDFCRVHEALLLILGQDTRERNFIVNRVSKLQSHWIGLTDHTTGQWRWIDGSPYIMDSSQWEPGEPNNLAEEDCAEITTSGKLNDGMCSKSFPFICKAPAKEN
ncbi:CD209 antigen-like protein C isoform X2 [Triplophysa dalaica]|uniref:CD209 antigen-like protein C isoform X2 n=1 Tax=Triplophysa dalaica TaxID=1582913 RepID=UPI0024E02B98|nr:CD209 antigen-like protein C isoform X2 [Triplophysa dalaica]